MAVNIYIYILKFLLFDIWPVFAKQHFPCCPSYLFRTTVYAVIKPRHHCTNQKRPQDRSYHICVLVDCTGPFVGQTLRWHIYFHPYTISRFASAMCIIYWIFRWWNRGPRRVLECFGPAWDSGCRNEDAGGIGLDAGAQLWKWLHHHLFIYLLLFAMFKLALLLPVH